MLPLRDDQPRYSTPWVNYFLIGLNLLIFLLEVTLDPRSLELLIRQFGVVPSHLGLFLAGSPRYPLPAIVLPFFTSMFLHGSWPHVIGNMWFLYIFGDNVEDYLGHFKYLVFYMLTGLIAMATQVAVNLHSTAPTVGASGAIAGVLGAYFVLYPRARVLTWFFELLILVVWVPAWIILIYWFFLNFLSGTATMLAIHRQNMGGVAFWAHIGGFISGALIIKLFPERSRRYPYAYQ
ncbi:MAG TPA: rhomboid family intramembrane serine protease [Candidatus Sulfotelmatobacter sp.]|jgi:membrane associated rhomboid family serine protease|nr:rhomboid family intramembrane serine protease [Candidatus Sulfotelmatobacter sp.]